VTHQTFLNSFVLLNVFGWLGWSFLIRVIKEEKHNKAMHAMGATGT
jgi:hypothetical protein